ncbi:DNA-binding response regulator [Nonlabens spongiae]|uniref:DNA-binding response regulator n=1 Tax=Nonlabens spongiae TaxID=331648 RepID=A0A1W6MGW8_9FLAO|nr:LytTR family DNA-binding domain-containing protein [Nonlabens spongiae]ARN76843.1 DNA-binding response regulator [Nonlabens spongiae]
MRSIIIEDEKPAARRLQRMVTEIDQAPVAVLHNVNDSIEYLKNNDHPDLIFLDIQLSDGLSFEIFDHVEVSSSIIFTTAYDEYALQAFKLNSIDYLLKPIDEEELKAAMDKFSSRFRESEKTTTTVQQLDLESIARLLQNPVDKQYKKRFTARVGEHIKLFPVDEVQLFYSENKGTYLNIENGRNYLIDSKLEALEDELEPQKFYRISRQAIVNVDAIQDIVAYTNSRLQVKIKSFDEFKLIVSRERVKDFKNWINR